MKIFGVDFSARSEVRDAPLGGMTSWGRFFSGWDMDAPAGAVSTAEALAVPAFWAGVNFLSASLAALPLHVYKVTKNGSERVEGGVSSLLQHAPNDETTSYAWRKYSFFQTFTGGRQFTWIERVPGRIVNLWPLDPTKVTLKRVDGKKVYCYSDGGRVQEYAASEIIDLPFALAPDQLCHYSPVVMGAGALNLALAMEKYGAKFFKGGGVPPLALEGTMPSGPEASARALDQVSEVISQAAAKAKQVVMIPPGYKLNPIGFDPDKGQMNDARRFQIEEIGRILGLPPVFLQDLTHGTFTNSEQQDLHLVKHTLTQWTMAHEQELNLKVFGRGNTKNYVKYNIDGLLRGDFITRMQGMAQGVQNALLTPNEGRALDNRPALSGGDDLLIQGATVPLGMQNMGDGNATA